MPGGQELTVKPKDAVIDLKAAHGSALRGAEIRGISCDFQGRVHMTFKATLVAS